ncbi:MAG: hypothetical protein ABGY32_13415 [bacterium]
MQRLRFLTASLASLLPCPPATSDREEGGLWVIDSSRFLDELLNRRTR